MRFIFFAIFFFPLTNIFSQNLLLNGSFEEENVCTEYRVNCAPEAWISTSNSFNNYFKDAGLAYSGSRCLAIQAGHSNRRYNRSFIRSQLLCALRKGNVYRLEFFVKARHNILDSVGIYFSSYDFLFEKKLPHQLTPALYGVDGLNKPAKGDSNWQRISFDYVAKGNEAFMTIGNFSKRDVTGATGIDRENNFFVFIDVVSFTPLNPNEKICPDWKKTRDEIYEMNERHEFLVRLIQYYRNKPPEPLKLSSTAIKVIDTLIVPDVLFATGSSNLQKNNYQLLDSFCKSLAVNQIDSLVIEGHTDSTGTQALNERLSRDRAQTVGNYLVSKISFDPGKMVISGFAGSRPVADNKTPDGRQKNRRVEIIIYYHDNHD